MPADGCVRVVDGYFRCGAFERQAFPATVQRRAAPCLAARAFVKDPELLILDEPLHGLDTYNRRRVRKIIEAFCRRRDKTMIMVTHYENELPETITHRLCLTRNR